MNDNVNSILVEFEKAKNYFSNLSGSIYENRSNNSDSISGNYAISGLSDTTNTVIQNTNSNIVDNTDMVNNIDNTKKILIKLSDNLTAISSKGINKEYSEIVNSVNNLIINLLQQIEYILATSTVITPEVIDSFSGLINNLYNIIKDLANIYLIDHKYDKEAELLLLKHKLKKDEILYKYKLYSNEVKSNENTIEYSFPIN